MGIIVDSALGKPVPLEGLKQAARRLTLCAEEGQPPNKNDVQVVVAQACSGMLQTREGFNGIRPFLESCSRGPIQGELALLTAQTEVRESKRDTAQQILEFKDTLRQIVGLQTGITRQAKDLRFIPLDDDSYKNLMGFIKLDPINSPEIGQIFIERLKRGDFDLLLLNALPKFEEWKPRNSMAEFNERFTRSKS